MRPIHAIALFRLSVLGPLASRERLKRGELKALIRELAKQHYDIPNSQHITISAKTIEAWYYRWCKGGIEALEPKARCDSGQSKLPPVIQEAILECKEDNSKRSLDTIKEYLDKQGYQVSRSSIYRLLAQKGLSTSTQAQAVIERRRFEASHAGESWYGDVMHGPQFNLIGHKRKVFLTSIMDDATRVVPHSAFCLGEKAVDIEGVLKQAVLKRGLCTKFVVDNGSAYRSQSLQNICARLGIRLIYCRPYEPEAKGKLERWHRVIRQQFLSEIDDDQPLGLAGLNAQLWAWIDQVYHQRAHSSLNGLTPLQRFQQDIEHIRPLGKYAHHLNEIFYHRVQRRVKKDGTIPYEGSDYEVPYELIGKQVVLVFDPHHCQPLFVESLDGTYLGAVAIVDVHANNTRKRVRTSIENDTEKSSLPPKHSIVAQALSRQEKALSQPLSKSSSTNRKSLSKENKKKSIDTAANKSEKED